MQIRFLAKENGSITVFLSIILIVILSFILTTVEAARITAAQATAKIYSSMAVRSYLGNYYYPLFEEYGILAIDSGFGRKLSDLQSVQDEIKGDMEKMIDNSRGGLVNLTDVELEDCVVYDLLDETEQNKAAFLTQVRTQAKYSLGSVVIDALLGDDAFELTNVMPEVYEKQSQAMEEAAAVNIELLKLMEIVDGVATTSTGFDIDLENELYSSKYFLKNFGLQDRTYMSSTYGLPVIFDLCSPYICDISGLCDMTLGLISRSEECARKVQNTKTLLNELSQEYANKVEEAADSLAENSAENPRISEEIASLQMRIQDVSLSLQALIVEHDSVTADAASMYEVLANQKSSFVEKSEEAMLVMSELILKKNVFENLISEYETFLKENDSIPVNILDSLLEDVASVRSYASLEKSGYDTDKMLETLTSDLLIIKMVDFSPWSAEKLSLVRAGINSLKKAASNMTYDGLKFNYSGIRKNASEYESVKQKLSDLFSEGVCTLLSVDDVSDKKLNGLDMVSEEFTSEKKSSITDTFQEMTSIVENLDIKELFSQGLQELSDDFLLEVYMTDNFSDFSMPHGNTKLDYEREYILAGEQTDASNLSEVLLKLVGFRAVFTFTSLAVDAKRSSEAMTFAEMILGATGNPVFVYALKYAVLVAWAIHEALVEVCALVAGKNIALFSTGGVLSFTEILAVTPSMIKAQSERLDSNPIGLPYSSYLLILSFLQSNSKKIPRILDLIQENIRLSYRDSFRIKNCITGVSFKCNTTTQKFYSAGFFTDQAYTYSFSDESFY